MAVLLSKLISIALIILGCILIMQKNMFKKIVDYAKKDNNVYYAAVLKIIIGIVFMYASPMSRIVWVVFLAGFLAVISGIAVFVLKKERISAVINDIYKDATPKTLNLLGTIPVLIGTLILCAI